jgi:hypothetical protein
MTSEAAMLADRAHQAASVMDKFSRLQAKSLEYRF